MFIDVNKLSTQKTVRLSPPRLYITRLTTAVKFHSNKHRELPYRETKSPRTESEQQSGATLKWLTVQHRGEWRNVAHPQPLSQYQLQRGQNKGSQPQQPPQTIQHSPPISNRGLQRDSRLSTRRAKSSFKADENHQFFGCRDFCTHLVIRRGADWRRI